VFPSDTSRLFEPTTGVHQFGGGSDSSTVIARSVGDEAIHRAAYAALDCIAGWARVTGHNTIYVDDRDPLAHGFQLK